MDGLSDAKLRIYREHFEVFDVNNDGVMSLRELGTALRSLGFHMSEKEVDELYKEIDQQKIGSHSGYIDFEQFIEVIMTKMKDPYSQSELMQAFKIFDVNDDGMVDAQELKQVCMKLGDKMKAADLDEIIQEADRNGDGKLSIEEFSEMLLQGQKAL